MSGCNVNKHNVYETSTKSVYARNRDNAHQTVHEKYTGDVDIKFNPNQSVCRVMIRYTLGYARREEIYMRALSSLVDFIH